MIESLILFTILIYGITTTITKSDLFLKFNIWYAETYPVWDHLYNKPIENPKKAFFPIRILHKIVNCPICTSFWSGIFLFFLGMKFINEPILSGLFAVGIYGLINIFESH